MFLVRLVFLPVRLALAAIGLALRTGWWTARLPVRVGVGSMKATGLKGFVCFFLGLGVGLLVAPWAGRETLAKLRGLASGGGAPAAPASAPLTGVTLPPAVDDIAPDAGEAAAESVDSADDAAVAGDAD